ncbi:MAG: hypothetical protein K8I82_00225, partial [Anaerolineae bacterium]|nr:hypothetical protein [Anaerolineae bacterium]
MELGKIWEIKHGADESKIGWAPIRRRRWGYYCADDHYEAAVAALVTPATRWLDVGGGRAIFPHNRPLSELLSKRCARLVAVDPSPNVWDNP